MKGSSLASRSRSLVCPLCEAGELKPSAQHSARCNSCAGSVGGAMLEALRRIVALPDALGTHACEEWPSRDAAPARRYVPLPGLSLGRTSARGLGKRRSKCKEPAAKHRGVEVER
jgi:hypothetical protein